MDVPKTTTKVEFNDPAKYDGILFEWLREANKLIKSRDEENSTDSEVEKDNFIHAYAEGNVRDSDLPIGEKFKKIDPRNIDIGIQHLVQILKLLREKEIDDKFLQVINLALTLNIPEEEITKKNDALRMLYISKIREILIELILKKVGFDIYTCRVLLREYSKNPGNESIIQELQRRLYARSAQYKHLNEALYGRPDEKLLHFSLIKVREEAEAIIADPNTTPLLQQVSNELLGILPAEKTEEDIKIGENLPSSETLGVFKESVISESRILEFLDKYAGSTGPDRKLEDREYTAQEAAEIFRQYLDFLYDGQPHPWKVLVEQKRNYIGIEHIKNNVKIPETATFRGDKIIELVLHEIFTHVGKRVHGERSNLYLLGYGLASSTDEGIATARQFAFRDSVSNFSGTENYVVVGLAYGLDRDPVKPRSFLEVFELMKIFYRYWLLKESSGKYNSYEELTKDAADKAYARCLRNYNGGPITVPGVVCTDDLAYKHDSYLTWHVVNSAVEKGEYSDKIFQIGKINLGNKQDIIYLRDLDTIDDKTLSLLIA